MNTAPPLCLFIVQVYLKKIVVLPIVAKNKSKLVNK